MLAEGGIEAVLFDLGQRPALTVGESLVPALVPVLRRLGVEGQVAELGTLKPGVSFRWSEDDVLRFSFESVAHCLPPYAYNVSRDLYDRVLLERARRAGVRIVTARAILEKTPNEGVGPASKTPTPEIRLSQGCLDAYCDGAPPDLIVDATGRSRLVTRLLGISAQRGPRNDAAYFAHFTGCRWTEAPGQVVINRLASGWSWRIPLRDRLSVGVVLPRDAAAVFGANPEERLDGVLRSDPELREETAAAVRVSSVAAYSNYQLVTSRGYGPGWVAIGDAFGFVDPMLSPGVFVAQRSAEILADRLLAALRPSVATERGLSQPIVAGCELYAQEMTQLLAAWRELIESFYDGSMFALYRAGRGMVAEWPGLLARRLQDHIERNVAEMATGGATTSRYSRGLLRLLRRYGLRGHDPLRFAIGTPPGTTGRGRLVTS